MSYELGTSELIATIDGLWDPGTVPQFAVDDLPQVQAAATQAVREALYITADQVEFHVITRDNLRPDTPLMRALWRVEMHVGGPMLAPETSTPHASGIVLRLTLYPHIERRQITYADDGSVTMPYPGVLSSAVAALLLRGFWGTGPREITVGSFGTGTFTPDEIRYQRMSYGGEVVAPIEQPDSFSDYRFVRPEGDPRKTAMWVVATDPTMAAAKVSYCVADAEAEESERWDDPDEAIPEFAVVDWEN